MFRVQCPCPSNRFPIREGYAAGERDADALREVDRGPWFMQRTWDHVTDVTLGYMQVIVPRDVWMSLVYYAGPFNPPAALAPECGESVNQCDSMMSSHDAFLAYAKEIKDQAVAGYAPDIKLVDCTGITQEAVAAMKDWDSDMTRDEDMVLPVRVAVLSRAAGDLVVAFNTGAWVMSDSGDTLEKVGL